MILVCNRVPKIENADTAVKRRTKLFPFESTWVTEAPKTEEEQIRQRLFQINKDFEHSIPFLANGFLWLLVKFYPIYFKENLIEPEIISKVTDFYWSNNDIFLQFKNECITESENDEIQINDLYTHFKNWFIAMFPKIKIPDKNIFIENLNKKLGKCDNYKWKNYSLIEPEF
jgi:phage/plasmid-associated DNA primase